jgi:hypothetical protein
MSNHFLAKEVDCTIRSRKIGDSFDHGSFRRTFEVKAIATMI